MSVIRAAGFSVLALVQTSWNVVIQSVIMAKRALRIVKRPPNPLAVCERCHCQFSSAKPGKEKADADIRAQFAAHKCRFTDSSQQPERHANQADSTEGK